MKKSINILTVTSILLSTLNTAQASLDVGFFNPQTCSASAQDLISAMPDTTTAVGFVKSAPTQGLLGMVSSVAGTCSSAIQGVIGTAPSTEVGFVAPLLDGTCAAPAPSFWSGLYNVAQSYVTSAGLQGTALLEQGQKLAAETLTAASTGGTELLNNVNEFYTTSCNSLVTLTNTLGTQTSVAYTQAQSVLTGATTAAIAHTSTFVTQAQTDLHSIAAVAMASPAMPYVVGAAVGAVITLTAVCIMPKIYKALTAKDAAEVTKTKTTKSKKKNRRHRR